MERTYVGIEMTLGIFISVVLYDMMHSTPVNQASAISRFRLHSLIVQLQESSSSPRRNERKREFPTKKSANKSPEDEEISVIK